MANDENQTPEQQIPTTEIELNEDELEQVNGGVINSYRPVALKIEISKAIPTDQKTNNSYE